MTRQIGESKVPAKKRYPLPKRFNAALSEKAYENLRKLNQQYHFSNNYLLTILLENMDAITKQGAVDRVMSEFAAEFGAPPPGGMNRPG